MCLITEQKKPIILKEDLIVKKLIYGIVDEKDFKIKPYGIVQSHYFYKKENKSKIKLEKINYGYEINKAIHCYSYQTNEFTFSYDFIFECLIPKGSKVFTDTGNIDDCEEIATDNLIFVKPLKRNIIREISRIKYISRFFSGNLKMNMFKFND